MTRQALARIGCCLAFATIGILAPFLAISEARFPSGILTPTTGLPGSEDLGRRNTFGALAIGNITPAGLRILRNGVPPRETSNADNFSGFPGTDFNSNQMIVVDAIKDPMRGVRSTARVWGNRALGKYRLKANPLTGPALHLADGAEARIEYTSYAKADAATLAVIAWHIGNQPHQQDHMGFLDIINTAGMDDSDWIEYSRARENVDILFTGTPHWGGNFRVMTDRVVSPDARMMDAAPQLRGGITLDWEVTDRRAGSEATSLILAAAKLLHAKGFQLIVGVNALNASVAGCGLDKDNLYLVNRAADFLDVTVTPLSREHDAAASIRDQLILLTGPGGKIPIDYLKLDLNVNIGVAGGELSLTDAATVRLAVLGVLPDVPPGFEGHTRFGAVRFSNGYGKPGGDPRRPFNQIVAKVLGLPMDVYVP